MDEAFWIRSDGRKKAGHIICANCGLVGHTMGKCPHRITAATNEPARPRHADVPRRCTCGAPTIHTTIGTILDDRPGRRDRIHVCKGALRAA